MSVQDSRCLLIVDGHHFAYRSYYAIRSMSTSDGFPTNAIYGFIKTIDRMRERVCPTHIAVLWDGGLDEGRTEILEEYKADRDPMPDDLEVQLDAIEDWLSASGLYSYCAEGVEADDLIATICKRARALSIKVVVASADKDFFQLIEPGVSLLNPNDKSGALWSADQVKSKTGVMPGQIIDWLSLMGDTVDGIRGVPGIGAKTAAKLLVEFGDVESIYSNLHSIKSEKLRSNLIEFREIVLRNKSIIRLNDNCDMEWELKTTEIRKGDKGRLEECYLNWQFGSLLDRLNEFDM